MCIRDRASVLGDYIPAKLGMEEGEQAVSMVATKDYQGYLLFFFENGKLAKVPLEAYATKTNRRKLTGAYSCLLYTSTSSQTSLKC